MCNDFEAKHVLFHVSLIPPTRIHIYQQYLGGKTNVFQSTLLRYLELIWFYSQFQLLPSGINDYQLRSGYTSNVGKEKSAPISMTFV